MSPTRMGTTIAGRSNLGTRRGRLGRLRRRLSRHRRWWAATVAAAAVFTTVQALRPAEPETVDVLVAARDLPAGRELADADIRRIPLPADAAPAGSLRVERLPTGRTLAASVREGTPLTDRSLVGRALLRSLPRGTVAAAVRIAETELVALLRTGDRVDVVAGAGAQGPVDVPSGPSRPGDSSEAWTSPGPSIVAREARVIALPRDDPDDAAMSATAGATGRVVLLAVPPETAVELAGSPPDTPLSLVLHRARS